jgi:hypothetical protein
MMRLSKAQALAIRELSEIEGALLRGDWAAARDASIKLAALSADRAAKEKRSSK